MTRRGTCDGGHSADDAEAKTGSLAHGFHPDRFEVDAVQSGVLGQAQAIAQVQRHDVDVELVAKAFGQGSEAG